MKISVTPFGKLPDGRTVDKITLCNPGGLSVSVIPYGAIITSIEMPDRSGNFENIVQGFDKLDAYLMDTYLTNYPYFGAVCGRYANRIARGQFNLKGKSYQLATNNGDNHLHGGLEGFDRKLWSYREMKSSNKVGVLMSYTSNDGEEGYPGKLEVGCLYTLNHLNELTIDYFATTDTTTIVNLTNHTYFNLNGSHRTILDHELLIPATTYTEFNNMIPTGKILPVKDSPYNFNQFRTIGERIEELEHGYDINYVLDNPGGRLIPAAILRERNSGRQVEVLTTQPGMQLYTGYWTPQLDVAGQKRFGRYSGVALETQHYPDSVNHPNFPSVVLNPDEKFHEQTRFAFSIFNEG